MRKVINEYFSKFDFDIRKSKDSRYVDQKCTPDIVCFIADCVVNLVATVPNFSSKDIWESSYFIENSRVIFNKPWANDKKVHNEYNKVLSQPLKLLAYAKILNVHKNGNTLNFSVENESLLDYIARKDLNAYNFLYCYFVKVMTDSGFIKNFEIYSQEATNSPEEARSTIYERYQRLIRGNTPTKSKLDITRMFHKVFNVYAVEHQLPGSNGKMMYYSDLMYNKTNWRDIDKDKTTPRKLAAKKKVDEAKQSAINSYYVQKAIALIRRLHTCSEVQDSWGNGEATQVHHIFPKSDFPEIAHYLENLILLTPTQHNTKAHPNNKTQQINKEYQLVCLLAKSRTIEASLIDYGDKYYNKESFIYVLLVGLGVAFDKEETFNNIRKKLINIYNAA